MRKITVFLMLICLLCVFSGCEGEQGIMGDTGDPGEQGEQGIPGEDAEFKEFTGTLGASLWDDELEVWILEFDTGGDNEFVLIVEVGFKEEGIPIWFEPQNWFYALDKKNNDVGIIIFPSEEMPIVQTGFDYKITFIY